MTDDADRETEVSRPDARATLALGAIARQAYADNPTDLNEVIRAIEGGQKLLGYVNRHLRALDSDRVNRETVNLLANAIQAMTQAHRTLAMTYALSGQDADDMIANIRRSFARTEEGPHG